MVGPAGERVMGPMGSTTANDPLFDAIGRMQRYRKANPDAIVGFPSETESHLWELSLPGEATRAYETMEALLDDNETDEGES
jgi:hypothetical protein